MPPLKLPLLLTKHISKAAIIRPFHNSSRIMSAQFALKGLSALSTIKPGEKKEFEVEGLEGAKVLLVNAGGQIGAFSPKCTHYGAPVRVVVVGM